MSESKHTAAPWVARQEFFNRWRIESLALGPNYVPVSVGVACTTILEVGCSDKDTAANAFLMAAAPDLLACLIDCREACLFDDDNGGIGVSEDVVISSELFDRICAAVNKASPPTREEGVRGND